MNDLSLYYGLTDSRMSASDIDLPVCPPPCLRASDMPAVHIVQLYYQTKKIYIFVNKTIFTCSYIIRQKKYLSLSTEAFLPVTVFKNFPTVT